MTLQNMVLRFTIQAKDEGSKALASTGAAATGAGMGLRAMAAGAATAAAAMGPLIAITAAVGAVFMAFKFMSDSIKMFIEFEDTMIRTKAVMGASEAQFQELQGEVKELGRTTRFTAQQVADAAQVLAIAGVSVDEMVSDKALENLLKLAQAGGVDIAEAAGIAVAAIKGFQMEMKDLERVNDVLTATFTSTNTEIGTIGESFKMIAPTAAAAGLEIEEMAAAVGILGNAGLKGSIAGTGLRAAINQLLKPSSDARMVMEQLGLDVFELNPAGQAAKTGLASVVKELGATKNTAQSVNAEIKSLTSSMGKMSLDQQRNQLQIMKIRRKAEKEGRDLTKEETDQISRLEGANADLEISLKEQGIKKQELTVQSKALAESEKALTTEFNTLSKTMEMGTTGLTSFEDVVKQLQESGATTTQILTLFGIRGANAMNALVASTEEFSTLKSNLEGAAGTTDAFIETIETSTQQGVKEMESAFQGLMLEVGEALIPILQELIPVVIEILEVFMKLMPVFKFGVALIMPFVRALGAIGDMINAILEGDFLGFLSALFDFAGNLTIALNPLLRVLNAIGEALGIFGEDGLWGSVKSGVSSAVDWVGGLIGLAEGGIVTKPTLAMVGEGDGPEAVIPIKKMDAMFGPQMTKAFLSAIGPGFDGGINTSASGAGSGSGTRASTSGPSVNLTIQNLSVGGGGNAESVRRMIVDELPKALMNEVRRANGRLV